MKAAALHLASLGHARYGGQGPAAARRGFVIDMPSTPDEAVCVYPSPSFPPDDDLSGYDNPELQVVVRTAKDAGHEVGYAAAEAIRLDLRDTASVVWAAGAEHEQHIFSCDANESAPVNLGPDANGRPRWSVSFQLKTLPEVSP
ncbi:minor capsid protein [Amycolatopsis thermoflava]|uniref:minor capsid protein n=1 Tax=Amycolatopsis thermoflava TaxID=84480 RepID=UPI0038150737